MSNDVKKVPKGKKRKLGQARKQLAPEAIEKALKNQLLETIKNARLHLKLALDKHKIPKSIFDKWMEDPDFSTDVYAAHAIAVETANSDLEKKDWTAYVISDDYFFDLGDGDV